MQQCGDPCVICLEMKEGNELAAGSVHLCFQKILGASEKPKYFVPLLIRV